MENNFKFADVLALIGLMQSVYLVVYIALRAGHIKNIIVPALCFILLSACFTLDFAVPRYKDWDLVGWSRDLAWIFVPSFSILLTKQVSNLGRLPTSKYWLTLLLPFMAGITGHVFLDHKGILLIGGVIAGSISFLFLWAFRRSFVTVDDEGSNKGERYWLIISFISMNVLIIFVSLLQVSGYVSSTDFILIRDVLGIGMVYLASTSLLRIYPQAINLIENGKSDKPDKILSEKDRQIVVRINTLLEMDKIYQEPNFSRADLARELDVSEANVSRIISAHFGKSLPQIINEFRVRDSLQLLSQTNASIGVIAEQVGFSSLPTFNRVFKDVMNLSPSEYRQSIKKVTL